jgi:signal transduction histidine kinase
MAVRNLLENAIRYTPAGGHVSAGIQRSDWSVRFWVRDTGQGALPEELPHLTERFYRGGNVAAGGLPIVKRVAELNDAHLHLRNMQEAVLKRYWNECGSTRQTDKSRVIGDRAIEVIPLHQVHAKLAQQGEGFAIFDVFRHH